MSAPSKFILTVMLGMVAAGFAPHANAQAIKTYAYQPNHVYEVHTGLGITTEIELGADEKMLGYSIGDVGWDLTARDNVLYLKPKNADVDTDLTVCTTTHAYAFKLTVITPSWTNMEGAMRGIDFRIVFTYPADTSTSPQEPKCQWNTQAMTTYVYQPNHVYEVHTRFGSAITEIELGADEKILSYSIGDAAGWELTLRGNRLFLKPKNVDVDTHLIVRTSTHAYTFKLMVDPITDWHDIEQTR